MRFDDLRLDVNGFLEGYLFMLFARVDFGWLDDWRNERTAWTMRASIFWD
jgi:hypothetical protein